MKRVYDSISPGQLLLLLAGDLIVLVVFVMIGRSDHGMSFSIWQSIVTAFPFMLAWIPIAWLTGAYRARAFAAGVGSALARALLASAIAIPVGLLLRTILYDKELFTSFFIVTMVFLTLFMLIWRGLFAAVARRFGP
ncbi:DUF3054 domain-containing protein [Paenibacillus thermoaerophilus]|uniref:DUF3054 domain-containing protein n=1 Tax=Paenibacillus thermoaerophilus TaxID=1215385 RepID=A0ABW2V6S8_9BACL|nr:DUF3054 domain-containing protein [Paenibacillus thermoaerophilus]TMV17917.1 DUF3054 domain-containing protein [Paenibacillus thermoaerophilus]